MYLRILLSLFLGLALLPGGFAQQKSYTLLWKGTHSFTQPDSTSTLRPALQGADYVATRNFMPELRLVMAGRKLAEYTTSQPVWQAITSAEKALLDTTMIAASVVPTVQVRNVMARRVPKAVVRITPFRRNPETGQLEKLMRFVPEYKSLSNAAMRRADADSVVPEAFKTGNWYRIGVTATGLHKLDFAALQRLGLNPASLNPRNLKIYGNGGRIISEKLTGAPVQGLKENAVWVEGQDDGRFDQGDYLLFYGEGTTTWSTGSGTMPLVHARNFYADTSYYFVTTDGNAGKRVTQAPAQTGTATVNTYTDRFVHELERTNILRTGRLWLGESFDINLTQRIAFPVPGLVVGGPVQVRAAMGAVSITLQSTFGVKLNGQALGTVVLESISNPSVNPFLNRAALKEEVFSTTAPSGNELAVELTYLKSRPDAVGYLDFVEVACQRRLGLYGNQTVFANPDTRVNLATTFEMGSLPQGARVWDITDPAQTQEQTLTGSQFTAATQGNLHEFIAFSGNDFPAPALLGNVPNQNLAGMQAPDLLIITDGGFLPAAQKLAQFRRSHNGMTVEVVTARQIYNEFSSGKQDLGGLREFGRYLYNQPGSRLKYVLLLGDMSFDYRSIGGAAANTAFVPGWQTRDANGLNAVAGYTTDDFIGYFDADEGDMSPDDMLDVGIGRLPAKTAAEALAVVEKIIDYSDNPAHLGAWRNALGFAADNGDGLLHMSDANRLSNLAESLAPAFTPTKLYLNSFPTVPSPGGLTSPAIRAAIQRRVEVGSLAFNYTGHGSEYQWTDERIFDPELIQTLNNRGRLPLFITATCEFGKCDDPAMVSSAEVLTLRPEGGAIGVISATRPVYASSNYDFNKAIYEAFFTPVNGEYPTLGDIFLYAKNNNISRSLNVPFLLFGDPSLRLSYPRHSVKVDRMTNLSGQSIDTIGALQTVVMRGHVESRTGTLQTGFNGRLQLTFYDKESEIPVSEGGTTGSYLVRRSIIFNGTTRVDSGRWQISFQVPLDINYSYGRGKMSFYAWDSANNVDANGYRIDSLTVGGTSSTASIDESPPSARLFMNDTTFRDGGVVGTDATFIARVSDDSGINVSLSGIGHEMTTFFSFNAKTPQVMNDYYVADEGAPNRGMVKYPLKGLTAGKYQASFKVWDLHNNSATATLRFEVREGNCVAISQVRAVPNPMREESSLVLSQTHVGKPLTVEAEVFDMLGRRIHQKEIRFEQAPAQINPGILRFNRRGMSNTSAPDGVYFYRVTARGADGCPASSTGRLVMNK